MAGDRHGVLPHRCGSDMLISPPTISCSLATISTPSNILQVLDPADTRKDAYLAKHLAKYPNERTPIHDTAKFIGGRPRDSTSARSSEPFIPLGEISIDTIASTPVPSKMLADPASGRFHISTFYVSRALHGSGIGGVTMGAAESMAARVLGAKYLTLDTLDKRALMSEEEGGLPEARAAMQRISEHITPVFSTQAWYERMGYRVIRSINEWDPKSSYVIRGGEPYEEYCLPSVWMEKALV